MTGETNNGRLAGKVAVITGGANGIGAAFARRFAAEGAKVVIGDLEDAGETVAAINAAGGSAIARKADVSNQAEVDALMEAAVEAFGNLDVLLNNAGLFTNLKFRSLCDLTEDEFDLVMRINARGVWQCVKAAVPHLRARPADRQEALGPGKIISIASTTALSGMPMMAHYVGSKGAVIAMTRGFARELGDDNICVNALSLGLTLSDRMVESGTFDHRRDYNIGARSLKREQSVDDCTGAAVHLASGDSDFVTGQSIVIDGGAVFR